DGRWLAYQSSESGRPEVYVRPFPDVGSARWQISTGGGERPIWSRDGQELFYVEPAGQGRRVLMRVAVQFAPSFTPGAVTPLFTAAFGSGFIGRDYDVTPDGQRFLMVKRAATAVENTNRPHMVLVQHWTQELKRLAPAK
ncbi:MAG TPA: hypothetical protein VM282_24835, partial [Acidimicrobiales bacterium]|nr:hypothetical protein [Acidimicrobiales bacterium]